MIKAGLDSIEPQQGMDSLDCLLASPFMQLAMFKTTSDAPQDLNNQAADRLTLYPALVPENLGMFDA